MTSSEVRSIRELRKFSGDAYAAVGASALVVDRRLQLPKIEASCRQIELWLEEISGFSTALDYSWSTDPEAYDLASEAAWQRRLMFMMLSAWMHARDKSEIEKHLQNVIVSQNFMTKFGMITPRVNRAAGGRARVIQVPAGFFELSSWMFAGLRCWCAFHAGPSASSEGADGWTLVTSTIAPVERFPLNHVTIMELIARTLADKGRDRDLLGPNVALRIRTEVPWFAGPSGDIDASRIKPVEGDLSYLVMEVLLAHELAHVLNGDTDAAGSKGTDAGEAGAHHVALALLEITTSSRQFGCDESLLEPATQSALCLTILEFFLRCRVVLADIVAEQTAHLGLSPDQGDEKLVLEDRSRMRLATSILEERLSSLGTQDKARALSLLRALRANGLGYASDLQAAVTSMPDHAIAAAARLAGEGLY
jgi:hypothetical protein